MVELGFDVPVTFGLQQHERIRSASELYGSAARGATVAFLLVLACCGRCVLLRAAASHGEVSWQSQ